MRILILHRVPYRKINYARCLEHELHEVTYFGEESALADLPLGLRCRKQVAKTDNIIEEVVAYAKSLNFSERFEVLLALSEIDLPAAAEIRERLQLATGPRPEDVSCARDKVLMKSLITAAGILAPRFLGFEGWHKNHAVIWDGPTILKPLEQCGSEGVQYFSNIGEAVTNWKNLADPQNYEIEEFVDAKIIHVDGIVRHGEIYDCIAHDYVGTCLDFAKGLPLGSAQRAEVSGALLNFSQACLSVLGVETGAFHLEAFERIGRDGVKEYVFLEVANRLGGGEVIALFEARKGLHLPTAEICVWLEEYAEQFGVDFELAEIQVRLEKRSPHSDKSLYGFGTFPGHLMGGKSCHVSFPPELLSDPNLIDLETFPPSEKLSTEITYHRWLAPAFFICEAEGEKDLLESMRRTFSMITVEPQIQC